MATLRDLSGGGPRVVEPVHTFGRASSSSERLVADFVSAQHAALRWTGTRWVLRDLGSRNGTFVDGQRIAPGEEQPILAGMKFAFGKPDANVFELVDDGPPGVMVVPVDRGEPVFLVGELLAVPSADDPQGTIYRGTELPWMLERADAATIPVTNFQTFEVAGRTWRFCCPEGICETAIATAQHDLEVRHLQLSFSVSQDEEHVALRMSFGGRTVDLGARSHNYLLITLARYRLEDAARGLPDSSCGWVYQEELATDLNVEPPQLNLEVYRLRRQFGAAGVADAANIIERRPRTRQLRIGTRHLNVVRV